MGSITAMGGGTVRDVLIGNAPVFWYLFKTCVCIFLMIFYTLHDVLIVMRLEW